MITKSKITCLKSRLLWIFILVSLFTFLALTSTASESAIVNKAKETLLSVVQSADAKKVTQLIQEGADVNAVSNVTAEANRTPLMLAAIDNKDPEILRILIEHGAQVNAIDYFGQTPLMLSIAHYSNHEIVRILLENGADVTIKDKEGSIASVYADVYVAKVRKGFGETSAYNLLREKTIENIKNPTELLFALAKSVTVSEAANFIQAGADVNFVSDTGKTPLMLVTWFNQNPEVMQFLIENGANVDAADVYGGTALMGAAEVSSNPQVLQVLIDNNADVSIKDEKGKTALDHAELNVELKKTKIYKILQDKTNPLVK